MDRVIDAPARRLKAHLKAEKGGDAELKSSYDATWR